MAAFNQHKKLALLLMFPHLAIIIIFFIWPAASALLQSFFFTDPFGMHKQFAGFTNFVDLAHDPSFLSALTISFVIAFFITLLTMSFGLKLAILVSGCVKGQALYKSLLLWPYAVAPAVAAILWRFLYQPSIGWVAHLCSLMGFEFNYLVHPYQSLTVIILTSSWQQFSYNFLFFFAALRAIPQDLIEAAILDGASPWKRFWQIILPLISPTSFFLLIMNLIYSFFDTFGIIDVLTHGGPESRTTTLMYKIYKDGFINMDLGSAAAQSILLMAIVVILTLIQFRYVEKRVHYL